MEGTAKELQKFIGREGIYHDSNGTLDWVVLVVNARYTYGRIQLRIVPKTGSGTAWVSENRVSFGNEN